MELKDYLHLYTNCQVVIDPQDENFRLAMFLGFTDENRLSAKVKYRSGPDGQINLLFIKPILRQLSSMTPEEKSTASSYSDMVADEQSSAIAMAHTVNYLLCRRFDLFGLIDAGLAVTKSH